MTHLRLWPSSGTPQGPPGTRSPAKFIRRQPVSTERKEVHPPKLPWTPPAVRGTVNQVNHRFDQPASSPTTACMFAGQMSLGITPSPSILGSVDCARF
jgi:hypothetical protein